MKTKQNEEMLKEYDFSRGIRGKYAKKYHQAANIVVLEPDVFKQFPNSESVNQALRTLTILKRRAI